MNRREFLIRSLGTMAAFGLAPGLCASTDNKKIIVLDPGHGMGNRKKGVYDPGVIHGDTYESHLVIDQAKRIKKLLETDFDVRLTREDEEAETSLSRRVQIANDANADIFVSLHVNGFTEESAKGARVYHYPGSQNGEKLGRSIQDRLVDNLIKRVSGFEQSYEGLKTEDFYVLKHTKMPAVLTEPGFLTNPRDRKYLIENPDVIAESIAEGIRGYFGG